MPQQEELDLVIDILDSIMSGALYKDKQGIQRCRYCMGEEMGYYDSRSFSHRAHCPVTLNEHLQQLKRERLAE